MTEEEIACALTALAGVVGETADEASGAPEVAWGDSFFYYDPLNRAEDRRFPFATIVIKDYPGFDTASDLGRPGVFRLNLNVGRVRFAELFGFPPAEFGTHRDTFDFTALDRVLPHPVYATQGWISVLVPGERTGDQVRELIAHAHRRASERHRP